MFMFKLSYFIVITIADLIDALVYIYSIVSLSHGIGKVSGMAGKKKKNSVS